MPTLPPTPTPAQLRATIVDLEGRALAHLDNGRTVQALALQAEAGELRRVLRGGRKAQFPSRRFSEQVTR